MNLSVNHLLETEISIYCSFLSKFSEWNCKILILWEFPHLLQNKKPCSKTVQCGNYYETLTTLELLESSQTTKCDGFCRNYYILLKISKE
ncbi:hypothetical protein LEP1GSC084_3079 [Leptospira interrogans serovar Medanensis str. L0448]|nr:hypothetical protein LEP1GSC084_3079 [Leptospira interrogans serovar Medanensis str. L0448]